MHRAILFVATAAVAAVATPAVAATSLTPEYVSARVSLKDDSLTTVAIIDTMAVDGSKRSDDIWLQAGISKASGATVFRVAGSTRYTDNWRFYTLGTYSTPDGPVAGPLRTSRKVVGCSVSCIKAESISLEIDEAALRKIAASPDAWRFRFEGSGKTWEDEMSPTEVAGFLAVVDGYRASRIR